MINAVDRFRHTLIGGVVVLYVHATMIGNAWADLPTPVAPEGAAPGNFLDWVRLWFAESVDVITLLAMAVVLAVVGYHVFQKFIEVRRGRAEMSELFVHGAAGAVVAVVVSYFLNEATEVIVSTT